MGENSKVFIASYDGGAHLYLVYDENGDPSSLTDQSVIRGGIPTEREHDSVLNIFQNYVDGLFSPGNIELEVNMDLGDSLDRLYGVETHGDRNYTTLTPPPGMTADQFWAALVAQANSMLNGAPDGDGDSRNLTDAPYTAIGGPGAFNSNSVIASLLAATGVDIYANLPKDGGDAGSTRLDASLFPQIENLFADGAGAQTIVIADGRMGSFIDLGSGDTTIKIDGQALIGNNPLELTADANSESTDEVRLEGLTLSDVKFMRRVGDDLQVFLTGDDDAPRLTLKGQFSSNGFDAIKVVDGETTYTYSLDNPSNFPVNAAVLPTATSTYITLTEDTFGPLETLTSTTATIVGQNLASLFSVDLSTNKATFADEIEFDINPASNLVLEADPEAETPKELILSYLDQLGGDVSEEDLEEALYEQLYPEATPYTATGEVEPTSFSSADYVFDTWSAPGATVTGEDLVEIIVGYDGETPIYGWVEPTNILNAHGDMSQHAITDVDVLNVEFGVSMTAEQLELFNEITGHSTDERFSIATVGGGTFDFGAANIDPGSDLHYILAHTWEDTTIIGSNQDNQILAASRFGDDTLTAGSGENVQLVAGGGKNTLTGSSAGGTIFVAVDGASAPGGIEYNGEWLTLSYFNGLTPGSELDGNGSDNILFANGDISGATISGIQTLRAASDIKLTETQFGSFTTIEAGGTLYAATGGTFNWSGHANASFSEARALSSDGTTLVANNADQHVTLYASESGNDELVAPTADEARTLDASNSTGDVILTVGDGDGNTVYAGFGENTITLGTGDGNQVVANHGLVAGSSIVSDNNTTSQLLANGDISGATISGIYQLESDQGVKLNATQLTGFGALSIGEDMTIIASAAGTYSLSGKTLIGSGGIFTLIGSTGADTLTGSIYGDFIYGEAGADTLNGGAEDDLLAGGDGDDTINGDDGDDSIDGGAGADTIRGGTGVDTIFGGAGNDVIQLFSGEVPSGEIIDGGDGTDRLVLGSNSMGPLATITNMEELYLNTGVTSISLAAAQLDDFDTITHQSGSGQAFSITAQAAGTYSLSGKTITGILTLIGSSGADTLTGTTGNDILRGGQGADTIQAGDGNDNMIIASGEVASGDSIDGGNGTDRLTVGNSGMNPSAMTVTNMEELYLNSGVTAITLSASQLADFETITQATSAAFSITAAAAGTYSLSGKTITGATTLNGTSGADTLTGSANADTINGNAGNDVIEGGAGNDTLNGGNDTDTLTYANAGSAVTVDLSNGSAQNTSGAGTDTISNFENLTGSAYNDTLTGNSGNNVILGGDGNDTINGGDGADTIDGGIGTNTLDGGTGDDTYVFERTYGASEIADHDTNSDTLQLGDDIARDQLWFRQDGNDLLVDVIGTSAQMRIADWYSGSDYQIEEIVTEEEDVLDHTNVQNLVNAMSSLSMPETTTLSPGYHTELDTVIAANWA